MDSDRTMRTKFLTFFDNTGKSGAWTYIRAPSEKHIRDKYPRLTVLHRDPEWFDDEMRRKIDTVDIDDPPNIFLRMMRRPLPTVYLELRIGVDDAPELRRLIMKLRHSEGFLLSKVGPYPLNIHGYRNPLFMMHLARSDMDIFVENPRKEDRYRIEICNADDSPAFEAVTAKFRELLESRWPGRVRQLAED